MLKICSFLPASTITLQELGFEELIAGVTFECPSTKPQVVRSRLEGYHLDSGEINGIVAEYKANGTELYYIDEDLLQQIQPDIIFTQDVCEVCQISTATVLKAVHKLNKQPTIVPLLPKTLTDVFNDIVTISRAVGHEKKGIELLSACSLRLDNISRTVQQFKLPKRKVLFIEWIDPIYTCGHWIPEMIVAAGGVDQLGNIGGYSGPVNFSSVIEYNPGVIVIGPCGFDESRTLIELNKLSDLKGWNDIAAVRNKEVHVVSGDIFTCPSSRIIEGIELLASLIHPAHFTRSKSFSLTKKLN